MDQNFSPTTLCIFTIFLLARKTLGTVQPDSQTCVSKTCGDGQNISYPFYIQEQQESSCGYPGFQLSCNGKGNPVFNLSSNDYIIHKIFYNNQSLLLSNTAVSEALTPDCTKRTPRIQNLSLPDDRFVLAPQQAEVALIYNCDFSMTQNYFYASTSCDGVNSSILALYKENPELGNVLKQCNDLVVAPVEVNGENGDIEEILRRGFLLQWTARNCSVCEESGGKCGFEVSTNHFNCVCPDGSQVMNCTAPKDDQDLVKPAPSAPNDDQSISRNGRGLNRKVVLVVAATGIAILIIILALCFWKNLPSNISMTFCKKKMKEHPNIELIFKNWGSLPPKSYSYLEIKKMTNSFREELGNGGYGRVYKGRLPDSREVAVKVLIESKGNGEDFINEVASMSRTSHVNIVTLLGFCFEDSRRALIYEYMPKGSLEKFIYESNSSDTNHRLKWKMLYEIAIGIGRGLEYLHRGCCNPQILHFDIKPHNILLDENFCPKISDFGLAKICQESKISVTGARGTIGYIAPEVFCRNYGRVSHKSDVYSYGMMVLEMVGGRKNIDVGADHTSDIYFPHWIYNHLELDEELELQGIANEEDKECARKMIIVSLWCIQTNPSDRPAMGRVLEMLEGTLDSLQIPPKPFLTSPYRSPAYSLTDSCTRKLIS